MTTCLGKSCSFGLPQVPFVNCCQFMYVVVYLLVFVGRDVGTDCNGLSFYFTTKKLKNSDGFLIKLLFLWLNFV